MNYRPSRGEGRWFFLWLFVMREYWRRLLFVCDNKYVITNHTFCVGRDAKHNNRRRCMEISTHTPRVGRDVRGGQNDAAKQNFNSHAPY